MRRHVTGLLLALLLLAVAVPATLGCCLGPPPGGGAHPWPAQARYAVADVVVAQVAAAQSSDGDSAVRDCSEHSAPAQTPYIETNNDTGGRGTVTARGFNAGLDPSAASLPAGAVPAHRYGMAADDTGPPLWLRTCVSRT